MPNRKNTTRKTDNTSPRPNPKATNSPIEEEPLVPEHPDPEPNQHAPHTVLRDRWHQHNTIPIIEVLWLDAISTGDDWVPEGELDTKPAPSIAIGYLAAQTPHTITLTALVNETHMANGLTIPRGCIHTIRTLQ